MALGIMDLPKAPADITPAKFFDEWLPKQLASFKDMIGTMGKDLAATMSFRVTGEGGGEWTTALSGGEVKVSQGLAPDAVVTVVMESGNFVGAVTGQMDELMQPPPGAKDMTPDQATARAKQNLEAMKSIHGAVKFEIEDQEKPFSAMIKFAGELKDDADVTVSMERENALAMARGETNPQAAFMSGQVKIQGDMTILMQLTPIMM